MRQFVRKSLQYIPLSNFGMKTYSCTGLSLNHEKTQVTLHQNNQQLDIKVPVETLLGSLIACENATARYLAQKMQINLGKIDFVKCEANYDVNLFVTGNGINKLQNINVEAIVETNADQEQLQKLVEQMKKSCPIYSMLHLAGVKIDTQWKKK